jgi:hypothetical protein
MYIDKTCVTKVRGKNEFNIQPEIKEYITNNFKHNSIFLRIMNTLVNNIKSHTDLFIN